MKKYLLMLLIIPPIAIGILVFKYNNSQKKAPPMAPHQESATTASVVKITPTDYIPRVVGYGTVDSSKSWKLIPRISGEVVKKHNDLRNGAIIKKGEVLIEIDKEALLLTEKSIRQGIDTTKIQIEQLEQNEKNYAEVLKLAEQMLEIRKAELERANNLLQTGGISQAEYDTAKASYISQLSQIQATKNSLNLIPVQKKSLEAQIIAYEIQLKEVELNISYTTIVAPYNCRIDNVSVELGQFVGAGSTLATCDSMDTAEISTPFSLENILALTPLSESTPNPSDITSLFKNKYSVSAKVKYTVGKIDYYWDANFVRVDSTVDNRTRTVSLILSVDDPFGVNANSNKPSLVKGMFCQVILSGKPRKNALVIPRTAVHSDKLYVCVDGKLEIRDYEAAHKYENVALITKGVKEGELLIVSEIAAPIKGMKIDPVRNELSEARIIAAATGKDGK